MSFYRKPIFLFLAIVLGSISGCADQTKTPSATPEVTSTSISFRVVPSQTVSPSSTPSPTWTITSTPTQIATYTPTLGPTLLPEQVEAWISDMLLTNGGCRLPCWWGIEPGKTTWAEVVRLVEPYASKIDVLKQDDGFVSGIYFFAIPEEISPSGFIYLGFSFNDAIIDSIGVMGIHEMNSYKLPTLLTTFGVPGDVYIWAYNLWGESGDQHQPMSIELFYPELGIYAKYSTDGEIIGDITRGCFKTGPEISLWNPIIVMSFTEYLDNSNIQYELPSLSIEKALSISPKTFHKMYKDDKQEVCIETPSVIWHWWIITPSPEE
jgi:hypothetical protein